MLYPKKVSLKERESIIKEGINSPVYASILTHVSFSQSDANTTKHLKLPQFIIKMIFSPSAVVLFFFLASIGTPTPVPPTPGEAVDKVSHAPNLVNQPPPFPPPPTSPPSPSQYSISRVLTYTNPPKTGTNILQHRPIRLRKLCPPVANQTRRGLSI